MISFCSKALSSKVCEQLELLQHAAMDSISHLRHASLLEAASSIFQIISERSQPSAVTEKALFSRGGLAVYICIVPYVRALQIVRIGCHSTIRLIHCLDDTVNQGSFCSSARTLSTRPRSYFLQLFMYICMLGIMLINATVTTPETVCPRPYILDMATNPFFLYSSP